MEQSVTPAPVDPTPRTSYAASTRGLHNVSRLGDTDAGLKLANLAVTVPYEVLHDLVRIEVEDWLADRGVEGYEDVEKKARFPCKHLFRLVKD